MRWALLIGCCTLMSLASGVPTRAWAQAESAGPKTGAEKDSDEERAARSLFTAGTIAFKEGRYEDALANFEQAYRLSRHAELLFNVGLVNERLFRFQQSIEAYEEYLSALPNPANRAAVEERIRLMRTKIAPPQNAEPLDEISAKASEPDQEAQEKQAPGDEKRAQGLHVLSPWYVWSGVALTLGTGGVTTWSALDTKSVHDKFVKHPTQSAADKGESAQLRTGVLIGATATFAVATAVVAVFFTDWQGGVQTERKGVALAPWLGRDLAGVSLTRGF
jgi:tetratricopeptide (TPR) repeat protein